MALTRITKGVIKPNENYDTHDINSTGIITATGLNVSGNASIGGVLTYEDVTNIDSVGIITARAGVRVNADGSTSSNYISVGANNDLKIYHENNNSYIKNTGAGDLYIDDDGGGVSLLYSGSNRLYTDITGVGVLGNVDATGFLSGEDGIRLPLVGGVGITTIEKGQASFTGIVTASSFSGDGSALTGVAAGLIIGNNANTYSNNSFSNITSNSQYNTIIGWNAGNAISTGDHNTIYGYRAGGVHNNSEETIIGANCFSERSSHTRAVGLGYGAGKWNEGDYNTAIGYESVGAHLNSDGNNNTGLGFQALRQIRSGSNNVALGFQADNAATTGSNRIVIGANADASAVDVSNEITLGDININHLRIPGIGVTFATSGNQISGISTFGDADNTFSETINLPSKKKLTFGDDSLWTQYRQGDLLYIKPENTSDTAQLWIESNNQMWIQSNANGLFLNSGAQNVMSLYGGYGGGIYFKNNGTQYLKLEYSNWEFLNNTEVRIPDKLVHAGDTNTMIRFPSDDTISFETSGSERLRIASSGQIGLGGANYGTSGQVLTSNGSGSAPTWQTASGGGGGVTSDSEENTVGGTDAGLNLDSDTYRNTLFGYQAGEQINSGDDNTCIGWKAADKLTNGSYNVAVGSEALENISSGSDNVAIGWEAGRSLTSGQGNTMIGHMAGRSMSGNDNIAIGDHAYSNGGGQRTIGLGGESVWLGGTDVIGIGQYTMARGSQTGGIGIGRYAGRNNTGDHNVYIGYEAGYGTGSSPYSTGEYNASLGYRSLYNITTGNKNVALGSEAGDVLTTGSNNIIIGDTADASSASISNEITLGNSSITKFRIPGLNNFEISDAGVLSGTASAATSANGFRNVTVSTSSPSGGSDGDVWIKYS